MTKREWVQHGERVRGRRRLNGRPYSTEPIQCFHLGRPKKARGACGPCYDAQNRREGGRAGLSRTRKT